MVPFKAKMDSEQIEVLCARLRSLGELGARPAWGRASASYDHLGAKLADAVLQSGVGYEVFVRKRVDRIVSEYASGHTASGFQAIIHRDGSAKVLGLARGRKLRTIEELTKFCVAERLETTADLRAW